MNQSFFNSVAFLTSAYKLNQLPQDKGREVAFAGRSNVGKSSLINAVCHRRGLVRVSKTPGRTQALNVFEIVSWLEQLFNPDFLPSDVYYISDIVADVRASEIFTYAISAFTITILATIYPAWRASKTLPAEALRYE